MGEERDGLAGIEISSHLQVINYDMTCMHRTELGTHSRKVSGVVFHVIFMLSCSKREMDKCQCFCCVCWKL